MSDVRRLDPKVKVLWFLPTAIILCIVMLVGAFLFFLLPDSSIYGISRPDFAILAVILPPFFGLAVYGWLHLHYVNFTYEIGSKELIVREGVLTRKTTVIPFGRIQDITSERTIADRMLGLATLEIETAGSSKLASSMMIPGIANKDALISEIMALVQKVRSTNGLEAEEHHISTDKLLAAILHEIKALSAKFEAAPGSKSQKDLFEAYSDFKKR
jgi:uncharacterized membrane protein YdbT with pleckstrin-like domain